MNKAALVAAALLAAPLALSAQEMRGSKEYDAPSAQPSPTTKGAEPDSRAATGNGALQSAFKDRITEAVEAVESACGSDIDEFCGKVPAGEGRVALCMLAHEDVLSARCRLGLYRAARGLKSDVADVAEGCLKEIQSLCGESGGVRQCVEQKRGTLSSSCQTIVGAVGQRIRRMADLTGMDVYSSDNKNLGKVVEVIKGPDGQVQSIQVDVGRVLGLGTKVVTITADKLERLPGIKLRLPEAEVRSLPEGKKQ